MASTKRKRKKLKVICTVVLLATGLAASLYIYSKISTIQITTINLDVKTSHLNAQDQPIQQPAQNITKELSLSYPTTQEFLGSNQTLPNIEFNPTASVPFTNGGYVNSISIKQTPNLFISKNFEVAREVTEVFNTGDPGIYYLTYKTPTARSTTKYIIPATREILQELNLGDTVNSQEQLKEVINTNLDINNLKVKFKYTQALPRNTQQLHPLIEEIIEERPELSCCSYNLKVIRDANNNIVNDSTAEITFTLDELINDQTYESQTLLLSNSVDAWLNKHNTDSPTDIDYIRTTLTYLLDYLTYDQTATSQSHPAINALTTGNGVCDSFTNILSIFLNTSGIPSELISGTYGKTGESHGWNDVTVNNTHYMVDVTGCLTLNETPTLALAGVTLQDLRALGYTVSSNKVADRQYPNRDLMLALIDQLSLDKLSALTNDQTVYLYLYSNTQPTTSDEKKLTELFDSNQLSYTDTHYSDNSYLRRYTRYQE